MPASNSILERNIPANSLRVLEMDGEPDEVDEDRFSNRFQSFVEDERQMSRALGPDSGFIPPLDDTKTRLQPQTYEIDENAEMVASAPKDSLRQTHLNEILNDQNNFQNEGTDYVDQRELGTFISQDDGRNGSMNQIGSFVEN